jgi:ABC-type multidrug transport system ATPase subunit
LTKEGRTVIATIHQSRSDLFPHFGNILLLAKGGQVAYSGKGSNMLQHFASLGQTCPSTTNPTDFVLDIVSVDLREERKEAVSREKVENLIRMFAAIQQDEKLAIQNE